MVAAAKTSPGLTGIISVYSRHVECVVKIERKEAAIKAFEGF